MSDEEKADSDAALPSEQESHDQESAGLGQTQGETHIDAASAQNPAPGIIGPYRLLQRVGTGGMGEVWVAEQSAPVKRRVALKLIKEGLGSKAIIARFEAERQALALMNHPNIARILDAGTTVQGQPYFVMELVTGKPLTAYCDENRLSIDQRLKLFMDVCSGVQHAHQKGIIHRDLKPGNIIVGMQDGKPVPKVIDFGLAKAMESTQRLTDQSLFTGIGQILGTLKYMSPEQASLDNLDIDTRTDIYALGVILYELLTGSTPLEDSSIKGQAAMKVLEIIREKEPVKPSSRLSSSTDQQVSTVTGQRRTDSLRLKRVLLGDLDWIVMKALDKDRTRRYESASGFAADIGRYLSSEPVVARPPSLNYRVRKFVRKNRGLVFSSAIVLLSVLLGLIGTIWFAIDANRAKELAKVEAERAIEKERVATENREQALNAVDDFFLIVSEEELLQRPGLHGLRAQLLSKASDYYERLLAQQKEAVDEDLDTLVRKLDVQVRYARMLNALGNFERAKSVLESALRDSRRITIGRETPENFVMTIARVYCDLATTSQRKGSLDEAEEACREGIKLMDNWRLLDSENPPLGIQVDLLVASAEISRLQGQISDARAQLHSAKEVAMSSNLSDHRGDPAELLAEVLVQLSKLANQTEAIDFLQQAIDIRRVQLELDPDDQRNRLVLGNALTDLAWTMRSQDPEKAISLFEEAEVLINTLHQENPSVVIYSNALSNTLDLVAFTKHQHGLSLDDIDIRKDLLEQSLEHYQRAETVLTASGKDARGVLDLQRLTNHQQSLLAMIYNGQALVWRDLGKLKDSLEKFEEAFEIQTLIAQQSPGEVKRHQDRAGTQYNMGRSLMRFNEPSEAINRFAKAVSIVRAAQEQFPEAEYLVFDLANSQSELNSALIAAGDFEELKSSYVPAGGLWSQAEDVLGRSLSFARLVSEITDFVMENLDQNDFASDQLLSFIQGRPELDAASLVNAGNRAAQLIDVISALDSPDNPILEKLIELGNAIVERLRQEHSFTDQQLSGYEHFH